jgi:Protein of unknown function DUF262/Protein of unknown function (DUF1524)
MKPDKLSVYQLFEAQRRHVVPLFQRPYVWEQDQHWEPLWEDIVRQVEAAGRREEARPHFLGAVVLNQLPIASRDIDTREIIDGQQRLTTLQIFLSATRRTSRDLGDERLSSEVERLTVNPLLTGSDDPFKVRPTKSDQPVPSAVMEAPSETDLLKSLSVDGKRSSLPRLASAYVYFLDRLRELMGDGKSADSTARLWDLHPALRERLQLVVIDLDESDDPQIIFETLNARGVPLLPSDLIRNYVLHRARAAGHEIESIYNNWWREFDERPAEDAARADDFFWKREVRQGRLKRPRLDLFFYHFLQHRSLREFNITRLYQEFCEWWASGRDEANSLSGNLENIRLSSETFARFLVPQGRYRERLFLERLLALDTSTLYPLLLELLGADSSLDVGQRDLILADLESFLIRRLVCRLTTKNYNKLFLSLLRQVREASPSVDIIRSRLLGSDDVAVRWPGDEEFRRAWLELPAYGYIRQDRIRSILEALEGELYTPRQERLGLDCVPTLEHIMPQSWHKNWPIVADAEPEPNEETAGQRRDRLLQTFGNLTLLTQSLNSEVSNASFDVKRPQITRQSVLRLNAYFQTVDIWTEEDILQRGESLFDLACRVWPRPPG